MKTSTKILLCLILMLYFSSAQSKSKVLPEDLRNTYVVFKDKRDVATGASIIEHRYQRKTRFKYNHAIHGISIDLLATVVDELRKDMSIQSVEKVVLIDYQAYSLPTGINTVITMPSSLVQIENID